MKFDDEFKEIKISHIIVIYLLTSIILLVAMICMSFNPSKEFDSKDTNVLSLISGILLFTMLIYKTNPTREKIKLLYKDFKNKLNIREIAWVVLFLICLSIGSTKIIVDIIYVISPSLANTFINDNALTVNSVTDYSICFVVLVILSPVVDELTFRYTLFKRLTKKFNVYVGLIVSTLIFSAINIQPEIVGVLALGIINCIVYVKYENILISMLIYVMNNLVTMIVLIPLGEFSKKTIYYTSNDMIMNAMFGVVLSTFGVISMIKYVIKNKIYLREQFYKSKNIE